MSNDYSEKFEKMRIAGKLASKTLDMLTNFIKPGISTDKIDNLRQYIIDQNQPEKVEHISKVRCCPCV